MVHPFAGKHLKLTAFLLSLSSFMVLKPVKNVLAFDLPKSPELGRDLLNLLRGRSPDSASVHFFESLQLLRRGVPPRAHQRLLNSVTIFIIYNNNTYIK